MERIIYFIFISFVHSADVQTNTTSSNNTSDDPYEILAPIEHEFTPETFAFFNVSKSCPGLELQCNLTNPALLKTGGCRIIGMFGILDYSEKVIEYKKFDLTELEHLSRRWDLWWYALFARTHYYNSELNQRACFLMCWTFLSAMPEIRKHFPLRYLYVNHLEYEIGYTTYDIVYRYQMMVEIYQIVYRKFYLQSWTYKAHVNYMFYMYRNLLEYSMTVIHLCNMMREIEKKYEKSPVGVWDDYPQSAEKERKKVRPTTNITDNIKNSVQDYVKRKVDEVKRRQRQRKKERKQVNRDNYKLTTPRRRPKKSFWPLHYGWSIEDW